MMDALDLGEVVAERTLRFEATAGWSREVKVRIGLPFCDGTQQHAPWICPYQISGLDRDRVIGIFGVDSMQALVLAVHAIPAELAAFMRSPGGRFLQHDKIDDGFLHACRTATEIVGDAFRDTDEDEGETAPVVPRQVWGPRRSAGVRYRSSERPPTAL